MLTVYAGDSFELRRDVPGRSAADGWVMSLRMAPRLTGAGYVALSYTGTADGATHVVAVDSATTAAWKAGIYSAMLWVVNQPAMFDGATLDLSFADQAYQQWGPDAHTAERFDIEVLPDPRQMEPGIDFRSLAQRTLDELKAAYASYVANRGHVSSYKVNEREMQFGSAADILSHIRYWEGQVAKEKHEARLKAGGKPLNRIKVRFTRGR